MRTKGPERTFLLLVFLHLAIALPLAYLLNIWADEASSLYTTQNGFLYALQNAAANEKQAPLYFWVLSLWRLIDGSIFFARLFSIICSVASILVFGRLARRLLDARAALLATTFFALHPFLIWASLEIRVYSLVILLSIVLLRFFIDGFLRPASLRRHRLAFLAVAIVALYTNYYLGFLLAGLLVALIAMRKWAAARDYILLMIVAGAAFSPMVLSLVSQFTAKTASFQEERSIIEGARYIWHHILTFILPTGILSGDRDAVPTAIRLWVARAGLVIIVVLTIMNRRRLSRATFAAALGVAAIGLCLFAAYFLLGPGYIALRHSSVLFVPLLVLASAFLTDLFGNSDKPTRAGKIATIVCGVLVLLSFAYSLATLHPNLTKRGDWARIGAFIEENETAGQPIIVFPVFSALALPYHYNGRNQVLPIDGFFRFAPEGTFGSAESLKSENEYAISIIPKDAESVWLALGEKCLISEACSPLQNYVRANYTIEIERDFYLERLYMLKKKQ